MLKLFKNFTKKDCFYIFFCFLLIVLHVCLELKIPDYMSSITTLIQNNEGSISKILNEGILMLSCALGSLVTAIVVGYFSSLLASSFSKNLRKQIFDKTMSLGMGEIKEFSTSSLITRTTNDVGQMQMLISMGLQVLIKAPIMAVWAITKILGKSLKWSLLVAFAVAILMTTIRIIMSIVLPRFEIVQKLIDKINSVSRENITGIRVIRAFNAEKFQTKRFEKVNNELTNTQLFNQKCFAALNPIMSLTTHLLTLGIYILGAFMIEKAVLPIKISLFGDMVVFSTYGMQVISSFLMLAMIFMMLPRAKVSAARINEVLNSESSIKEGHVGHISNELGCLEFKNVSFKYPDAEEYVLKDISFNAVSGDTVAFIGSTGSGKSTLINLIPRFYDVTDGEILIDGVNIKDYTFKELGNKIGYISQKAVMFTGSVLDNVSFGTHFSKKPSDENILKALEVSQSKEFVDKMGEGVNSHIARGGTNVSGGQKQRLSIARAIARKPEIYIFDDSFSALDYKTDSLVRKNLKQYCQESIFLIVAQRIGTILNADKIIVLDKGKCVGIGTHKELMKSCKIYQEIALSQLSKEELYNA